MAYSPAKHLARRLAAIQDGIVPIPVEDGSVTNAKLAPVIVQSIKANPTDGLVSPGDLAIGTNSLVGRGTGDLRSLALGAGLSITSGVLNGEAVPETAAELLAKIITVDGIGSSLDADLLDGQHAAAFATAAQGALAGTASQPGHTHAQSDVTGLSGALSGKQDALTSGTTIKTVNGESLLGAGNVVIAGGGAAPLSQVTLNVSPVAIGYKEIIVGNGAVTALSKITADLVPELDAENDIEGLADIGMRVWAIAEAGQVRFVLTALGAFVGPFKVNYGVAA